MGETGMIDAYCERLEPGIWAEPLNAVTNLAFLIAAVVMWWRSGGRGLAGLMCLSLAGIGVASGLWHTLARGWAGAADGLSILVFVMIYLFAANRRFLALGPWTSAGLTVAALPVLGLSAAGLAQVPGLHDAAPYLPVAMLILAYGAGLVRRRPGVARGLAAGGGVLLFSIAARAADAPLCGVFPVGTHFLWHVLNAVLLGWMIEVYLRAGRE